VGANSCNYKIAATDAFNAKLFPQVSEIVSGRIRENVAASALTTMAVGGPLRALVTVEDARELSVVRALLHEEAQTTASLGFGSNLLVSDDGFAGWIIKLGNSFRDSFRGVEALGAGLFRISGAASLMSVARKLSDDGFSGLEFAAGIPASVGGAIFMNAGAHGGEICERVVSVNGVLENGEIVQWQCGELPWRYRSSGLPLGATVTSVDLQLVPGDRTIISQACADNLAHRRRTQPLSLPSFGSVFKNPSLETTAGKLLEMAGLKGMRLGGAQVSELHANWIVNPDKQASAADIAGLIAQCIERVRDVSGITLQPEVRVWG